MSKDLEMPKLIRNHPAEVYSRYHAICREVSRYCNTPGKVTANEKLVRMICSWLDAGIGRENRLDLFERCFNREINSSSDLTDKEKFGLLLWVEPSRTDRIDDFWHGGQQWYEDMAVLISYYHK